MLCKSIKVPAISNNQRFWNNKTTDVEEQKVKEEKITKRKNEVSVFDTSFLMKGAFMNQEEMVIEVEVRNSEKKKKYFSEISRKIEEQKKEETSNDDI